MTSDAAVAVRHATDLLKSVRPAGPTATASSPALPTAGLQQTLATLCNATSAEDLLATQPDVKNLLKGALDWFGPATSRATKPVVKNVAATLLGQSDDGCSTFAQGVEMVSYLALWAPLLEPDRLARVAAVATTTRQAYAPIRFLLGPAGQLRQLLSHYPAERREQLAISLWDQSHRGQWFHFTDPAHVRSPRRAPRRHVHDEERVALAEQVQSLLGDEGQRPTTPVLARALTVGALTYSADHAALFRATPAPAHRDYVEFSQALRCCVDEDHRTLASFVPWLLPADRPESPVTEMIALLLTLYGGPTQFHPGLIPAKPHQFSDLYPAVSHEPFEYPDAVLALSYQPVPGLRGADLVVVDNAADLQRNGEFMGNCTFSLRSRCLSGSLVLVRFAYAGEYYNASYTYNHAHHAVTLTEAKARFNQRVTNDHVRRALGAIGEALTRAFHA